MSVVIPAFQAERYIDAAIESVVDQTLPAHEVIVVDDGSTDATAERCARWAPRVLLLRQANGGTGTARNAGLARATGELLAFLDADDVWSPNKLERQVEHLVAHPDEVAVFGWMQNFVDPDAGVVVGPRTPMHPVPAYQPVTMLARRRAFEAIGRFDEDGHLQGWIDWYLRLRESGMPIGMIDELVCHRRIHGANLTMRPGADMQEYGRLLAASLRRRRLAAERPD